MLKTCFGRKFFLLQSKCYMGSKSKYKCLISDNEYKCNVKTYKACRPHVEVVVSAETCLLHLKSLFYFKLLCLSCSLDPPSAREASEQQYNQN